MDLRGGVGPPPRDDGACQGGVFDPPPRDDGGGYISVIHQYGNKVTTNLYILTACA